jgi:hypothetical protein
MTKPGGMPLIDSFGESSEHFLPHRVTSIDETKSRKLRGRRLLLNSAFWSSEIYNTRKSFDKI